MMMTSRWMMRTTTRSHIMERSAAAVAQERVHRRSRNASSSNLEGPEL